MFEAAPQLKDYKKDVRAALSQSLQNKRKYKNDLESGKRKTKA